MLGGQARTGKEDRTGRTGQGGQARTGRTGKEDRTRQGGQAGQDRKEGQDRTGREIYLNKAGRNPSAHTSIVCI